MLDKSVVYKNIIMKIDFDKMQEIVPPKLPDGYSFRLFADGDESHWARIETSVLEFPACEKAFEYFGLEFLPYRNELNRRCLFIVNQNRFPVATANSWFVDGMQGRRALLHWVAVCAEYQGMGLGKAVVQQALVNFQGIEPGKPVWLHTQTWSHAAVKLYHSLGFSMMKNEEVAYVDKRDGRIRVYPNDYYEAIEILKTVMDFEDVSRLISTAE